MLAGLNTVWTGMKCTTEHPPIYVSLLSLPSNIVSSHECTKAYCNCGGSDAVNRVWQPPLPKLLRLYIIDTTPLRKSLGSFRAGHAVVVFKTAKRRKERSRRTSSITCEHPLWEIPPSAPTSNHRSLVCPLAREQLRVFWIERYGWTYFFSKSRIFFFFY